MKENHANREKSQTNINKEMKEDRIGSVKLNELCENRFHVVALMNILY